MFENLSERLQSRLETMCALLKTLLDRVNVEDKGCTEKVYRGLCSTMANPGHLSHLERPNYDFAQYLNTKINGNV